MFVFFFNCSTEKNSWKKIGENKIIGLLVRCHKLIIVETRKLKTDQMDELDLYD